MREARIDFDIRLARPTDLKAILAIERQSFGREAWDESFFSVLLDHYPGLFLVAAMQRGLAGYSITCLRARRAELFSIAVAERHRRHGAAALLMACTLRRLRAQRVQSWWLMVRATNEPAIRFYWKFGFERRRRVPDYYENGGDAWRMELVLP